jgi:hypothetical protein
MPPKLSLFFKFSYQNFGRISDFCIYDKCPTRHVYLDFVTPWSSPLSHSLQYFAASPLVALNVILNLWFLNAPKSCCSLRAKDHVSRQYKTTGTNPVSYKLSR